MAVTAVTPTARPAEQFFRASLSLLVLASILTLTSTGKLDLLTSLVAPLAALHRSYRWWHGHPAELSHRAATWSLLAYLAFFPVVALFLSRFFVGEVANPSLFALLIAVVPLLPFASFIWLSSTASAA